MPIYENPLMDIFGPPRRPGQYLLIFLNSDPEVSLKQVETILKTSGTDLQSFIAGEIKVTPDIVDSLRPVLESDADSLLTSQLVCDFYDLNGKRPNRSEFREFSKSIGISGVLAPQM